MPLDDLKTNVLKKQQQRVSGPLMCVLQVVRVGIVSIMAKPWIPQKSLFVQTSLCCIMVIIIFDLNGYGDC